MPFFPNVPSTPGVPSVFRLPGQIETAIVPLLADVNDLLGGPTFAWGVYTAGYEQALAADSVLGVEYREETTISDYPIEAGQFQSYNKVRRPYSARVQFAKSGTSAEREEFLRTCEDLIDSLDSYQIITPERTYDNANIVSYDYQRRSQEGAQMLVVELQIEQVRTDAATEFSATKTASPASADAVNNGTVQVISIGGQAVNGPAL